MKDKFSCTNFTLLISVDKEYQLFQIFIVLHNHPCKHCGTYYGQIHIKKELSYSDFICITVHGGHVLSLAVWHMPSLMELLPLTVAQP
jgi:hypothetical protein